MSSRMPASVSTSTKDTHMISDPIEKEAPSTHSVTIKPVERGVNKDTENLLRDLNNL